MKEANYKPPKVEKYDCPVCGNAMKVSFGSPAESICAECKQSLLKEHETDTLKKCAFCNSDKVRYQLSVPYYYGAVGVRVRCDCCGALSGVGGVYRYEDLGCSKPPLFNRETIEDGFKNANEKWNRRAADESPFYT